MVFGRGGAAIKGGGLAVLSAIGTFCRSTLIGPRRGVITRSMPGGLGLVVRSGIVELFGRSTTAGVLMRSGNVEGMIGLIIDDGLLTLEIDGVPVLPSKGVVLIGDEITISLGAPAGVSEGLCRTLGELPAASKKL